MRDPDFALVEATARGDRKAFEALVRRYQEPLLNFIYRYVGDRSTAEDLAQEVFIRVFQAAARFEPRARVSTWIFKIACNLSMNEVKRRRRMAAVDLETVVEFLPPPDFGHAADRELKVDVMTAMGQLPEKQRAALLLRANEGLSYQEIAEVMELSVPGVESLLFRARRNLKQMLGKAGKG